MVAMVAAGCGFYGDGPQWQEDSRGFSYLVASHSPPIPPTTSLQQTGAVATVAVYQGERKSQLPPRNFTACSWKDRCHRMVSASTVKGDCLREQFSPDGDRWHMFEPSRQSLWEPIPNVPF